MSRAGAVGTGEIVALDDPESQPFEVTGLVAIDAPLVVTNLKGARPAERELNSVFNVFEAGARPAFKSNALFDPPRGAVEQA